MVKQKEVIVIGGGLAGLAATMRLAENGCRVKLISLTKVKRSHSVAAQGGINAAFQGSDDEDSPLIHAYDTIKGGDFLANQPPIIDMCLTAPLIIEMMAKLGCPFNRTHQGTLDFRRFGGTLYQRTAFCGSSTGQQLLYTLDEQVRKFEAIGMVEKFENHEFMRLVLDDEDRARGVVIMNLFNLKLDFLKADAVVIASGGLGFLFKKSTNSTICTGSANARLFKQGMKYANAEFIQIHPTAIPGEDKMRLISESLRGEGGRIWVYGDETKMIKTPTGQLVPCGKTGEPWYFLEELYPALGNLVPRDIGSREILNVCRLGLGVDGKEQVYLDIRHLSKDKLKKLSSVLSIYKKFTGEDPSQTPMKIFPAVHYSMGGAYVDYPVASDLNFDKRFRHMTNLKGCFNCGESDYQYHGANRLGANALLSCIFSGLVVGDDLVRYLNTLSTSYESISDKVYINALRIEEDYKRELFMREGKENVYQLHEELASHLIYHVTVVRNNQDLKKTQEAILDIEKRLKYAQIVDRSAFANQTYIFTNQFNAMIEIAKVMVKGALTVSLELI